MPRRKYNSTRKRDALKFLAAIAVLAVFISSTTILGFLPSNGLRQSEQSSGTGRTRVVGSFYDKELGTWVYLAQNDRALLLSVSGLTFFGWQNLGECSKALSGDGAALGYYPICKGKTEAYYAFGKVQGGNTAGVESLLYDTNGGAPDVPMKNLVFREKGGDVYFLCCAYLGYPYQSGASDNYVSYGIHVKAVDSGGKVLTEKSLERPDLSTMG